MQILLGEGVGPHAAVGGATVGFGQHPYNLYPLRFILLLGDELLQF